MGVAYNPKVVTSNLVMCLDAANKRSYPGSGTSYIDISGSNNSASFVGSPTYDANNGGSFLLDGSSMAFSTSYTMDNSGATSYTVETFGKLTDLNFRYRYFSNAGASGGWELSAIDFGTINLNTGNTTISSGVTADLNWHQVVGVWGPSTTKIYVDGVLKNTGSTFFPASFNPVNFGRSTVVNGWYSGNLGPLRVYNRVLTDAEIWQNFNAVRGRFGI